MSGPRQEAKRLFLPNHRTSMPNRHAIPSMKTKSQFDVWGAPMRIVGCAGAGWVRSVHRLVSQNARAIRERSMLSP